MADAADYATEINERQQVLNKDEWCRRFSEHLLNNHAGIEKHEAELASKYHWFHAEREREGFPERRQKSPWESAENELFFWED